MKKVISRFVRLLIVLSCLVVPFARIGGVSAQAAAQLPVAEAIIGNALFDSLPIDSRALSFNEAKAKEPRLMSEAETSKVFAPIDRNYLEKQDKDPNIVAQREQWHKQHEELLSARRKSMPVLPNVAAPESLPAPEILPTMVPSPPMRASLSAAQLASGPQPWLRKPFIISKPPSNASAAKMSLRPSARSWRRPSSPP